MKKRLLEITGVVFLIVSGLALITYKLPMVSATYDEGFSYLTNGDYLVRNFRWDKPYILLHPPLSYYLHGLPSLVFSGLNGDQQLLFARLSMLPVYVLFAGLIYYFTRRWFGRIAAFIALILYLFNPEILAHARLITPDHLLALGVFTTHISFYYLLQNPSSKKNLLVTGVCLGLTFISKYNGLLMVPLLIFLTIIYQLRSRKFGWQIYLSLIGIMLVGLFFIHAAYLFKETGKKTVEFKSPTMQKITEIAPVKPMLETVFPRAYLTGADFQMYESSKGVWWGYFAGKYYGAGLWYFYPAVFDIKTPLPFLILIFIALVMYLRKKILAGTFLPTIILFSVVYFFIYFMFFNKLIIGLRYLLMVYPLLIIFVAGLGEIKQLRMKIILGTLLIWYIFDSFKIAPFYLAYANETIGGPKNLWKYVADSNLDWNQDQKFFDEYKKRHPEISAINPIDPVAGKIAMNVNHISLWYFNQTKWIRDLNKEPIDEVGYTWLIFEVTPEELAKVENK